MFTIIVNTKDELHIKLRAIIRQATFNIALNNKNEPFKQQLMEHLYYSTTIRDILNAKKNDDFAIAERFIDQNKRQIIIIAKAALVELEKNLSKYLDEIELLNINENDNN